MRSVPTTTRSLAGAGHTLAKCAMSLAALLAILPVGCARAPARPAGQVINPYVTTDRSVDTRSVQTIADSLTRPGMSDRDKALAAYNYIRRTMFHYRFLTRTMGRDAGGAADLINMVGYCLCTPTAGAQAEICEAMGLQAEVLSTPGHGSCVVRWDGRWHWMDAFLGLTAWNSQRTDLAGVNELLGNPALLDREDPAPAPLLPCVDVLYADALRFEPASTDYHAACGPTDRDWLSRCEDGGQKRMVWDTTFSPDITLRPGESYTRTWDHEPGMFMLTKVQERFAPPHHFCGQQAEQRDTANWPYWRPYVKPITSPDPKTGETTTVHTGRYWANGRVNWTPDLSADNALEFFTATENAATTGDGLAAVDPDKPLVVEWETRLPYMLQGGRLLLETEGRATVSVKTPTGEWTDLPDSGDGVQFVGDFRPALLKTPGARALRIRIGLTGPGALLKRLEQSTVFQHNMQAQPQLMPGDNVVTVELDNPAALAGTRLVVEYAWDAPDGRLRTRREVVTDSPRSFTIRVEGDRIPRMRHLRLANEG